METLRLTELRLQGWRNIQDATWAPGPGINVLWGNNGEGKTNFLEAVFYLATFRSFRTNRSQELISWGHNKAQALAKLAYQGLDRELDSVISTGANSAKAFVLDGKPVRRDSDRLQGVGAVLFVPEDLQLVRGSPALRRRFLDLAIFAGFRGYLREMGDFVRALKNRNAVLRNPEGWDRNAVAAYDEAFAAHGARIMVRRAEMIHLMRPAFIRYFEAIHGPLAPDIGYRTDRFGDAVLNQLSGTVFEQAQMDGVESDLRAALKEMLVSNWETDCRRRFTSGGPQNHDVAIRLSEHPAKSHASQGQVRSLTLSLKLAELERLSDATGEPPLLLMDDMSSELDANRRGMLFETVGRLAGQTVLTLTDPDMLPESTTRHAFQVRAGSFV